MFTEVYPVSPFVEYKLVNIETDLACFVFGVTWIVCGALILIAPYVLVRLAYLVMTIVLGIDLYCHIKLDHGAKKLFPVTSLFSLTLFQLLDGGGYYVKQKHE